MQKRDRLDELIESSPHPRALAESCFRHWVEQALDSHREFTKAFSVQPAPAGEKKPFAGACCCGTIGICVTPGVIHRTDGPCFMDRRKGERREHQAYITAIKYDTATGNNAGPEAMKYPIPDRRSGKERRSK